MSVYDCGGESSAWTSELVIVSFEDAMRTLRSLPFRGYSTRMSSLRIELPADDWPADPQGAALKLPVPSGRAIDQMDCALSWISFIPKDRIALRKIVLLRAVTNGVEKPMSWAKIARAIGADTAAIKPWHSQAIAILTRELNSRRVPVPCTSSFP